MRWLWPAFVLLGCTGVGAGASGDGAVAEIDGDGGRVWLNERPTASTDGGYYEFPCLQERAPTGEASLEAVFHEVFCAYGCASPYCHGSRAASGGLDLDAPAIAHAGLVGVQSQGAASVCRDRGLARVVPGDPDASLLYLKVAGEAPCGGPMPPPEHSWPRLSDAHLDQLRRWIEAGALADP